MIRRYGTGTSSHGAWAWSGVGKDEVVIRVFVLDDHDLVRRGLRELLEAEDDIELVGDAGTAEEALRRIPPLRPDVAVLDIRLPDGDGIEVCREIRSQEDAPACLMLTSFADDEALVAAVVAGAAGYVLKEIRSGDLVRSIRRVAAGESLLDPAVTRRVIERLRSGPPGDERLESLSDQERRVLALVTEGLTNREIGEQLFLAEKTIKNYMSNVLTKLGLKRRTEAAVYALRAEQRPGAPR